MQEIERGEHVADRDTVTFGAAAQHWLNRLRSRAQMADRMSPETVITYENALGRALPTFVAMKLNAIKLEDVQAFIEQISSRLSAGSVRLTFRSIFMVF